MDHIQEMNTPCTEEESTKLQLNSQRVPMTPSMVPTLPSPTPEIESPSTVLTKPSSMEAEGVTSVTELVDTAGPTMDVA